jgi:hypothetical protein
VESISPFRRAVVPSLALAVALLCVSAPAAAPPSGRTSAAYKKANAACASLRKS